MEYVMNAQPYREYALRPEGKAENMLIRQFRFPHVYDRGDAFLTKESSHLLEREKERVEGCYRRTMWHEDQLESWLRDSPSGEILDFLKELLQPEKSRPGFAWTGFRVLGTVRKGKRIFIFILFAKHKDSKTEVYSGDHAPNVRGYG